MPIIVGGVTTPPPPPPPGGPPPAAAPVLPRQLRLRGGNGDTLLLTDPAAGWKVLSTRGVLGMPPVDVARRDGAGDGTRWQRTRRAERTMDLAVRAAAPDGPGLRAMLTRLAEILDDEHGPPSLDVLTPEGAGRTIACHYTGGMELVLDGGSEGGAVYQRMPVTLLAPQPYWQDLYPPAPTVWAVATGNVFLSLTVLFSAARLTSSQVLGTVTLTNPGDAPAPVVWRVTGPGGPTTITTDAGGFVLSAVLGAGAVRVVDSDAKSVVDANGVNKYSELAVAPKLVPVPPGVSVATVSMTGATGASSVTMAITPRYKLGS